MNRAWAQAWDELAVMAVEMCPDYSEVRTVRDGHRFMLTWSKSDVDVFVWADENEPRFGARVGTRRGLHDEQVSFKTWSTFVLESLIKTAVAAARYEARS